MTKMETRPMRYPVPVLARGAILAALLSGGLPATPASAAVPATTTVADVRGVSSDSGRKTMVTYQVAHDFHGRVEPFTALPGARIPRTAAFDGMWADVGFMGSWLAPTGSFRFQFNPRSRLVEDAYYTNWLLQEPEAVAMEPGDRFEIAMGHTGWDTPLPTDRPRGTANGRLEWDTAVDVRQVTARQGADTGEMDALFIRAEIVARGGDVDARTGDVRTVPLVVDLPRTYPKQAQGMYQINVQYPFTHYVSGMTMRVLPAAGKAVIQANVRGYLHEGREYRMPGGADIKEWHIPLNAFVNVSSSDDPFAAAGVAQMPAGGVSVVGEIGGKERTLRVGQGGVVTAGDGTTPRVVDQAPMADDALPPTDMDEFRAADMVDRSLAEPVDLRVGNGSYDLTLDPDFRGEGVLALANVRRHTGTPFTESMAVPYIVVDGVPLRLDRSRLAGLRVFPIYRWVGIQSTSAGGSGALHKVRTHLGAAVKPGMTFEAVYDLGLDRFAFVDVTGAADSRVAPSLPTRVTVISLGLTPVQARTVYHQELPAGPVTYGGEDRPTEFQANHDLLSAADDPDREPVEIGPRSFSGSAITPEMKGRVTVMRGPAPLTPDPQPDPSRTLDGAPVAFVYEMPPDQPSGWNRWTTAIVRLSDPEAGTPAPKPIGTPCGTPQATDGPLPDAPPDLDVVEAWFDADAANLYATIRLRQAPSPPPSDTVYGYALHWRHQHSFYAARARLASDGTWSFQHTSGTVAGETSGTLLRVTVPRERTDLRDGDLLRDTGAHSWVEAQSRTTFIDSAPQGSDATYGSGGDYVVGRCQ